MSSTRRYKAFILKINMAQHKNPLLRYKALDDCFSNPYKEFYIDDLIKYCSDSLTEYYCEETTVSRRQILADIGFMKNKEPYNAPIISFRSGHKVFYRYEDLDFSIFKTALNPSDLNTLTQALETLSRMNNIPGFEWVKTILTKLNSGLNLQSDTKQIISFEENQFLVGLEYLNPLYQFISKRKSIDVIYEGFSSQRNVYTISPYYLKQYNNRWFIFGLNHSNNKIQNLALDRIQEIHLSKVFYVESKINFEEYFEDVFGVSIPYSAKPELIELEVSNELFPYLISKPIHGSQIVKKSEEKNVITLELIINYEVKSELLSFGDQIRINKPAYLQEFIKNKLTAALANYI